jgi:hypothetical protein
MDSQRVVKSEYDLARELVEDEVAQHIGSWAAAIGLTRTDTGLWTDAWRPTERSPNSTTRLKVYSNPKASAPRRWSTPVVEQLAWDDYWQRFARFYEDVTEGLHACMRMHIAGKHRR